MESSSKMKNNWPNVKLSEVSLFLRGNGLSKKDLVENGKNKCILYGQLYTMYGATIEKVISRTDIKTNISSKSGDVLVPATTTADELGIAVASALNEDDILIGNDINILRTENKKVDSKFLSYSLNGPLKLTLASYARGTNIIHLSGRDIAKIELSIPEIKIQKKIVERLDEIRKAQELIDLQIQKTEELYNSLIQQSISISKNKVKLLEVTQPQETVNPKNTPNQEFQYVDISAINSRDFTVNQSEIKKFEGKNAPSRARKKIQQGDVLFSTVRPNLKRIAIIDYPVFNSLASTGFAVLRPDENKINPSYFGTITCSGIVTNQVIPYIRGAAYPAVSDTNVFNAEIPLPDRKKQDELTKKFTTVQKYKKLLQKQKQLYKELFDSVLAKSMKGEMD